VSSQNVGRTAIGAMAFKAMESFLPEKQRLFDDSLSVQFLPPGLRFIVRQRLLRTVLQSVLDRQLPGTYGGMVCRTRYLDDVVTASLSAGIRNIVIVGAGLDTRPYRLELSAAARVFELDLPAMIEAKKKRVTQALGRLPGHVTYIAIDFDSEDLGEALTRGSLDPQARLILLLEGVTQYIRKQAVESILQYVAQAPRGSEAVFTYVPKEVIDGTSKAFGADESANIGRRYHWVSGFDRAQLPGDLNRLGLDLVEDVGAIDYEARYLAPLQRSLKVFEIERIARARVPEGPHGNV
jgi:methyltransferase (TIGR00027 family)